jgi:Zn-dependent protease with chaperone function
MTELAMPQPATSPSSVRRWETEIPLLILVILVSIVMWIAVAVSMIGIFYAAFLSVFFLLAQVGFVAHLRGSAIKLGPQQMPELHARVVAIASRIGLAKVPDAYLMQAGGTLNAMATKLFRSNFIILYSDLVEACGDDAEAVDFIVGHELGHLKAGHLRFQWVIILGRLFPFIGSAYSRAREYTADRYGLAGINDPHAATRGLTVLAAGGGHARRVNLAAMMQQRHDMTSVWMTIGRWMSTHPPLVDRIAELDRSAGGERIVSTRAVLGAAGLIAVAFVLPIAGGGFFLRKFMAKIQQQQAAVAQTSSAAPERPKVIVADVPAAVARAQKEMRELADTADKYLALTGRYPEDSESLYAMWRLDHPRDPEPRDPFDATRYGYTSEDGKYEIWSLGAFQENIKAQLKITSAESAHPAAKPAPHGR